MTADQIWAVIGKFAAVYSDDDARRLVACWNAFEGLDTEMVESMVNVPEFFFKHTDLLAQRDELMAACKLFIAYDNNDATDGVAMMIAYNNAVTAARAAIAKAEGAKAGEAG